MNLEAELVDWLNEHPDVHELGIEAFLDVPADRPRRFVTIERTGGDQDLHIDRPILAVQVWDETRLAAADTSIALIPILERAWELPDVARIDINSRHNFPDENRPRYQIVLQVTTKK